MICDFGNRVWITCGAIFSGAVGQACTATVKLGAVAEGKLPAAASIRA